MIKLANLLEKLFINMNVYAVAKGRFPGIYFSWADCKKQVDQFPGAKYKKFSTEREARSFVAEWGSNSTHSNEGPSFSGADTQQSTYLENVCSSSNVDVHQHVFSDSTIVDTEAHGKGESATASQFQKRLVQLEQKQEEISKKLQAELEELRGNFCVLDTRLSKIEARVFGKTDLNHATVKEKVNDICKVDAIFKEEFGLLREKIYRFKNQTTESCEKSDDASSNRQRLKEILHEEIKPKVLGSRAGSSKTTLAEDSSIGGKRRYSTQSTGQPVKVAKLDYSNNVSSSIPFIVNGDGYIEVYTDGACEKNGRRGAKAGIGVWFGDDHPLNLSEPVVGRATNNMAEIQAATYAVETAKKAGVKKLLLHTDSNFLINCITCWIKKWKKNDWHVATGEPVKNREELIVLDNKLQGIDVKWNHVRGHRGIHGNEMADYLAREGAKRYLQITCDDEDF